MPESRRLSAVAWRQPSSRPSVKPLPALSSQWLSWHPAWRRVTAGPSPPPVSQRAPVGFLIIGVLGAPLLTAVQHHLGIDRVGLNFAPVVISPAMPLALWLAANPLLESVRGWMKASLAVRTAAGLGQCVSSEIERDSNF